MPESFEYTNRLLSAMQTMVSHQEETTKAIMALREDLRNSVYKSQSATDKIQMVLDGRLAFLETKMNNDHEARRELVRGIGKLNFSLIGLISVVMGLITVIILLATKTKI